MKAAPVVSAVAILSLALGIGANTAMFSILDSLLLRSLPVKDPQRLVNGRPIAATAERRGPTRSGSRSATARALRRRVRLVEHALQPLAGRTDRVRRRRLGERALLRRARRPGRSSAGRSPPTTTGAAAGPTARWRSSATRSGSGGSAARPTSIGRSLTVERVPFTIVGVTPPGFFGVDVGRTFDVAIPLGTEPLIRGKESTLDRRSNWWLNVMVRLRPGSVARGRADRAARRAAADPRGDDAAGLAAKTTSRAT